MFETVSVFDAMELDNTHLRVASRRALALAHNRVESNLGRFLRGAQSETEFLERLALVADDFEGYVVTASAEVGHDHPEHIAAALKDHYRLATDKVEFEETPAEEQEKKDEEVVASVTEVSPKKAKKALKRMAKAGRTWKQAMPLEGEQGSPLGNEPWAFGQNDQGQYPIQQGSPLGGNEVCPECRGQGCINCQWTGQTDIPQGEAVDPSGNLINHPPTPANPYGPYGPESDVNHRQRDIGPFGGRDAKTADMYTGDESSGHKEVTCPECGGDGKTAGATACGKCKGKGKVPNFGDSVLDAYFGKTADGRYPHPNPLDEHWDIDRPAFFDQRGINATDPIRNQQGYIRGDQGIPKDIAHDEGYENIPYVVNPNDPRTQRDYGNDSGLEVAPTLPPVYPGPNAPVRQGANQNNTDLDGPEPKMDKRLWTPSNPGKPKYEDGPRHPTKDKDPTEVIGPMRNDHELSEIHGQGTHYKKETLPTQDGDEPFASNNMEMAPHTKTFGDKDQHDPVTHETLESVQSSADDPHKNPLAELLQSEWPANQAVTAAFPQ